MRGWGRRERQRRRRVSELPTWEYLVRAAVNTLAHPIGNDAAALCALQYSSHSIIIAS